MTISGVSSNTNSVQNAANSLFAKIDTKNQGYIDASELQTAFSQISGDGQGTPSDATNFMSQVDTNGDGKISKQELTDGMQKVADQLNTQFSASRVNSAQGASQPSAAVAGGTLAASGPQHAGGAHKSHGGGGGAKSSSDATTVYAAADTNQDGVVSPEELLAYQGTQASVTGAGDASQTSPQNSMDAIKKMADRLAQSYGQFNQNADMAVDAANSVSELA